MDYRFVLIIIGFLAAALLALDLLFSGIAAIFGASFRKFFLYGLWIFAVMAVLMLWGAFVGRNSYAVKKVDITARNLPENFDGYQIAQISDLHLESFRHRRKSLERSFIKLNSLRPDLAVFTGDLVTSTAAEIDGFEDILPVLQAPDGVISILGNHDYCYYHRWSDESQRLMSLKRVIDSERAAGWNLLLNQNVSVCRGTDSLSIIGVENTSASKYFQSSGDLKKAMVGAGGDFRILLTHDPTHWDMEVKDKTDIDLTLSGHTHALQFSLFGWSPSRLFFKEFRGLYMNDAAKGKATGKPQYLYVNIGMGETGIPVRIGTRPEITLFTLHRGE